MINVDYAPNVIERMKQLTDINRYPKIEWHAANCLDGLARFDPTNQGFSVVIDKSLCDCIACGDLDDLAMQRQLSDHVLSVTRPNGVWLSISFSSERDHPPPSNPTCKGWTWQQEQAIPIEQQQQGGNPGTRPPIYYYLYILRKVPYPNV